MRNVSAKWVRFLFLLPSLLTLTACATHHYGQNGYYVSEYDPEEYASRMPQHIETKEKVVIVNPNVHSWGAYDRDGNLVKAGIATAGGKQCEDSDRSCKTDIGTFRVESLGDGECYSHIYPLPHGGGLMPYCMFFHNGEALHGSPEGAVVEANISHGCVRLRIPDAEWLRYNFVSKGTKVVIQDY